VAIHINSFPNAFPSLHLATALVFVLTAKDRFWRGVSLAFFAGTALATLTTGEHYVIDLIAGMAFGCFAASVGSLKWGRAIGYLGISLSWALAIRFAVNALIAHPDMVRLLAVLTVGTAVYAVWMEWNAAGRRVPGLETIRAKEEISMPAVPTA